MIYTMSKLKLALASGTIAALFLPALALALNPSDDGDCATIVTDPYSGETGTRADVYGCKAIGNSGEEQGIYTLTGNATLFGYPAAYGACDIVVRWSGDY